MSARNCWTCHHDILVHGGTRREHHVCGAAWSSEVVEWVEVHVAPDSPGVPPSMPRRNAPPCPKWAPLFAELAESGRKVAE